MKPIVLVAVLLAAAAPRDAGYSGHGARRGRVPEERLPRLSHHPEVRHADRPNLTQVGRKYQPEYLARWLRDPSQQRPSAHARA